MIATRLGEGRWKRSEDIRFSRCKVQPASLLAGFDKLFGFVEGRGIDEHNDLFFRSWVEAIAQALILCFHISVQNSLDHFIKSVQHVIQIVNQISSIPTNDNKERDD